MNSYNPIRQLRPIFLTVFALLPFLTSAQTHEDSVAKASSYFKMGMDVYDFSHRKQAAELFVLATKFSPGDAKAQLMAGKSIMQTINKEQSLPYFLRAVNLNPAVDEDILYFIGQGYHYAEKFDSAILFYTAFNHKLSRSLRFERSVMMNKVDRKIFECRNAVVYKANPVKVTITDLPLSINSEFPDYAPTLTADGTKMIFTSRRADNNANNRVADDHEYYEEILESRKVDGVWQPARILPEPVNSKYHNSCLNLSPDGTEMFIYNDTNGGDIYETHLRNGIWSAEDPLEGEVNTASLENSATITRDGKKLFFTSSRPGGYGGTDIYMCTRTRSGRWINATNLGPIVNTELDEDGVFISASGKHLYFSSNGHAGMGDLDIYRSTYDSVKGEWSTPVNMGYPINTPENDIYFVLSGDEKTAYYSSVKADNKGEQDIYLVDMTTWKELDIAELVAAANPKTLQQALHPDRKPRAGEIDLQLIVVDAFSSAPLDAKVTLVGPDRNLISLPALNKGNHSIHFTAQSGKVERFSVRVTAGDYQEYESHLFMVGQLDDVVQISDTVYMKKSAPVQVTGILNAYFPTESDVPQSIVDVWSIEKYLKDNTSATLQISGHTDSNGEATYNMDLSRRRAESVKNYLIRSGIPADRITALGFGEEKPVADNLTSKGRSLNRRTEFTILNYSGPPRMKKDF